MKKTFRHLYLLFAAASCFAAVGCAAPRGPGQVAPDFKLDSVAGRSVVLSQYKGNVVLLGFWAVG